MPHISFYIILCLKITLFNVDCTKKRTIKKRIKKWTIKNLGKDCIKLPPKDSFTLYSPTSLQLWVPNNSAIGLAPFLHRFYELWYRHSKKPQISLKVLLLCHSIICIACVCVCSVVPNSLQSHGLLPTRLLCPWDSAGKNTGVDCHFFLWGSSWSRDQIRVSCIACFGRWILYH